MADIKDMIARARKAFDEIQDYSQEQVDRLCYAAAKIIYENADPLGKLAVDETRIGDYPTKILKNENTAAETWYHLKDKKSVGIIDGPDEKGIITVAHPVGVIGAITPATNPTITPLGNFMHAIKGKNAIIFSPAPRAEKTTVETINLIRQAMKENGAPEDLIQIIEKTNIELSAELMKEVDLVLATGSAGLTKAAYSSGTPAYGGGPGNTQSILDRGFDIEKAAPMIVEGVGADNGILCDGTNMLLYPKEEEKELFEALEKEGCRIFTSKEDVAKFRDVIFTDDKLEPGLIGVHAHVLADAAGISVEKETKIIGLKVEDVGRVDCLNREILAPVVRLYGYDTFEDAVALAIRNMEESGGTGHTGGIYSNDMEHIKYAGTEIPVSRMMVNQPTPDAWGPNTNGLAPAVMECCGTWGNNIVTDNIDYIHCLNISRIVLRLEDKEAVDPAEVFKD